MEHKSVVSFFVKYITLLTTTSPIFLISKFPYTCSTSLKKSIRKRLHLKFCPRRQTVVEFLKVWERILKPSGFSGHIRIRLEQITLDIKVWTFWEGHKNWKNLPLLIWRYSVASNFKWKIFSNFVPFSECPNFIIMNNKSVPSECGIY